MKGPCAKRQTRCVIIGTDGQRYVGANICLNAQPECPRLPGEGYEKCQSVCEQRGHAEIEALTSAGEHARGAKAYLSGHYYICEPCGRALREAGVRSIEIELCQ